MQGGGELHRRKLDGDAKEEEDATVVELQVEVNIQVREALFEMC